MIEEPDITVGPLSIWVEGRQFEESDDFRDGNFLDIRAEVREPGAIVSCEGPILRTDELQVFLDQLETAHQALAGTVRLTGIVHLAAREPGLEIELVFRPRGVVSLNIGITPDHLSQSHRFQTGTDQSYLSETIRQMRTVLKDYPVVGTPPQQAEPLQASHLARVGSGLLDIVFGKKVDPS